MTVSALRGATTPSAGSSRPGHQPDKRGEQAGELCPDEIAVLDQIRASGEHIRPRDLHRIYQFVTANADIDYDTGSAVLTYIRNRQSHNADATVGDRVANHLLRRGL